MKKMLMLGMVAVAASACERAEDVPDLQTDTAAVAPDAAAQQEDTRVVMLRNAEGDSVATAVLRTQDGGVEIALAVTGVAPGEHGFHIHQTGACEAPSFESAGGHFAPAGNQHGTENPAGPHAGDLPNVTVGADSTADMTATAENVSLMAGGTNSLLDADGSALVLHEGPDDYQTDPSGDSGARVACGVIQ